MTTLKGQPSYSLPDAARKRPSLKLTPDPASVESLERLAAAWGEPGKPIPLSRAFDRVMAEAIALFEGTKKKHR